MDRPKDQRNVLSAAERALVVAVATSKTFQDLPPSQIVPILADAGVYLASEVNIRFTGISGGSEISALNGKD